MINQLKKYRAFAYGFIVTLIIIVIFDDADVIIIPDNLGIQDFLLFVFWWFIISLPIYKYPTLKKKKAIIGKIAALIVFLIVIMIIDASIDYPDNPLTFILIFTFWLGVIYLFSPGFVKKYFKYIVAVYSIIFSYFTFIRLFTPDIQTYIETEKGFALTLIVLPIPVFFVLWIYEQWRWLKTLKAEKAGAELALLKNQINPHFFFNTLNNLYGLTVEKSDEAPEVVLKLSDIMRYTIYKGQKDFVPLQDEVSYLQSYIELHKIRYHRKAEIKFHISVNNQIEVAPLLFIILLENAFKHGVEKLIVNAYINISLIETEDGIEFEICNNFDPSEESNEPGIGLKNLKRRLELIYPENYELSFSKSNTEYIAKLKINI